MTNNSLISRVLVSVNRSAANYVISLVFNHQDVDLFLVRVRMK